LLKEESLRLDAATSRFLRRQYSVEVASGEAAGQKVALKSVLRVGSQVDEGELKISDPTVSRFHAELSVTPKGVLVKDLGSKNGTFVGGARVQEVLLQRPASIEVGRVLLKLSMAEADAGAPAEQAEFGGMTTFSPAMRAIFGVLARVAPTSSTVLLQGETGTGKERFAHAIHRASMRNTGPFIVVDCGALSGSLIESELFGHRKGSFTGALADRKGAFLEADGGTIFLDEVGELPLDLQPRLLRVLESGTIKHVGDDESKTVDVRVIAATHRNLSKLAQSGQFRTDLLYRLDVVTVQVPPLRARIEDLPVLVKLFSAEMGMSDFELSPPALARLQAWEWPGNIRELRNVVERSLTSNEEVVVEGAANTEGSVSYKDAKERVIDAFTKDFIAQLYRRCGGNISEVARQSGLNRNHVARLIAKYHLRG
jgi:DNA-binding NtrC family response regulator